MTITAKQDLFNETDHLSLLGRSRFAPEPAPQRGRKQEPFVRLGRAERLRMDFDARDRALLGSDEGDWGACCLSFALSLRRMREQGLVVAVPKAVLIGLGISGVGVKPAETAAVWSGRELVLVPELPERFTARALRQRSRIAIIDRLGKDATECVELWTIALKAVRRPFLSPTADVGGGRLQIAWELGRLEADSPSFEMALRAEVDGRTVLARGTRPAMARDLPAGGWVAEVDDGAGRRISFWLGDIARDLADEAVLGHLVAGGELLEQGYLER